MHDLGERLLRAGIRPAVVARYLRELADHRDDVENELRATGLDAPAARAVAVERLGSAEVLAAPLLADPRLRTVSHRFPLLAWLGLPLLVEAGLVVLTTVAVMLAIDAGAPLSLAEGTATMLLLLAPIAIGWRLIASGRARRAGWRWPVGGALATIILGAALRIEVDTSALALSIALPDPGHLALAAVFVVCPLVHKGRFA